MFSQTLTPNTILKEHFLYKIRDRIYLDVHDVMELTDRKKRQSYYIIENLNKIYKEAGHTPIKGKVPKDVFDTYYQGHLADLKESDNDSNLSLSKHSVFKSHN